MNLELKRYSWLNRITWIFVSFFAASFYLNLGLNTLAFIGCLSVLIVGTTWTRYFSSLASSPARLAGIALFCWYLLSVAWSTNQQVAWNEVLSKASLLLIPLFASCYPLSNNQFKSVKRVFAYGAVFTIGLAFVLALISRVGADNPIGLLDAISYENLGNQVHFQPIYLSLYVMVAFFILLWDGLQNAYKWYVSGSLLSLFVAMILLSSRTETVIFVFLLMVILVLWGYQTGKLKLMLIVCSVIGLLAVGIVMASPTGRTRFVELFDTTTPYGENKYGGRGLRIEKWKNTIECWQDYKLVGTGVGDYKTILEDTYRKNNFEVGYVNHYNSHNQYLQTLLGTGVIGLLLLLAYFFFGLKEAWGTRNYLAITIIVAFGLSCLTESMLERQRGLVFFVFMMHFLLAEQKQNS